MKNIIKRSLSMLLVLCMMVAASANGLAAIAAEGDVAIDETNFPDAIFRQYVSDNFDGDGDGVLSKSEAESVTNITANDMGIHSLVGIEHFTELTDLWCNNNQITSIDLTSNTKLVQFDCSRNQLTELYVSNNTELTDLLCAYNQLTSLDVTNNPKLAQFVCESNQLATLDISNNTELTDLFCDYNQLTSLDVTNNAKLIQLACSNNRLTELVVINNTELESLVCNENNLTALSVDQNTKLSNLRCRTNQITSLDISKNTALTSLYCGNNLITALDLSNNTQLIASYCRFETQYINYEASFNGSKWEVDLGNLVGKDNLSNVNITEVVPDKFSYDYDTGVFTFSSKPERVEYTYYTGLKDMDVIVYANAEDVDLYDVWVNGEQFTSKKLTIACGDGTATYDPTTNTITLNNAEISNAGSNYWYNGAIYISSSDNFNINLVGNNKIRLDESDADEHDRINAIYIYGWPDYASISGDGSLEIDITGTADNSIYGLGSYDPIDYIIKDTTISVTCRGSAQYLTALSASEIINSTVSVNIEDIDFTYGLSNNNSYIDYCGLYGDIINSDVKVNIGDIKVTSANENLTRIEVYGIRNSADIIDSDLEILIGDVTIESENENAYSRIHGADGAGYDITNSTVSVSVGTADRNIGFREEGSGSFMDSTVTILADNAKESSCALQGIPSIIHSTVTATSGDSDRSTAIVFYNDHTISDSKVTATSGKALNGESIGINSYRLTVSNSEVISVANEATRGSYGMRVDSTFISNSSTINATANKTSNGISGGIIASGDALIEGGKLTATANAAVNSYGIQAQNITIDGAATEVSAAGGTGSGIKFGYGLYATEQIYINAGTVEATGSDSGIAFDGAMCKIVSGKITAISDGMAFSNTPNISSYQNPYVTVNTKANASGASVWNQSKYPSLSSTALKYVHIEPGDGTMLTFAITGSDKGTVQYSTDGGTTKLTAANGDSVKVSGDVILYVKPYSGNEVKTFKIGSSNGNISAAAGSGYTVNLSSSATATIAFDVAPEDDDTTTPSNPTTTPTNPTTPTTPTTPTQPTTPSNPNKPSLIFADRLYGDARYDTAIAISKEGWNKAETVIIANGENYPDALAGTVLSKSLDAPILLVNGKTIDSKVLAEIKRLGADKVVILGGYSAVSKDIEETLIKNNTIISRIAGSNRNGTAADIALKVTDKSDVVFLVSNNGYADALSASSVAAIKGAPILYLNPDGSIPSETKEALAALGCKEAYIIGGAKAVDTSAEKALTALKVKSTRISGADRYATSIAVFDKFSGIFDSGKASVATGAKFPDALAGAALAAKLNMPTLLTGSPASAALKNRIDALETETLYVFGGSNAIPDSVVSDLTA